MRSPKQILAAAQTTSDVFNLEGGQTFILLRAHAGGTWKLQLLTPDGEWVDIGDNSSGVAFDGDGLQFFYSQGYLSYRLTGGNAGALAWIFDDALVPGVTQ